MNENCDKIKKTGETVESGGNPDFTAKDFIFCANCGAKLISEQKFCHRCGNPIERAGTVEEKKNIGIASKSIRKKKNRRQFVVDLVKSALILAMAILMLAAAFLPMIRWEINLSELTKDDEKERIQVRYSAIDGIGLLVNSFFSLDEDDMEDARKELAESAENSEDDWLEGDDLNGFAKWIKQELALRLKSEDVKTTAGMILVAVFSFAQIVLSVLLIALAVPTFISSLTDKVRGFSRASFLLLGLTALVMFVNAYAFRNEFGLHIADMKFTVMQICIPIFTLCVFAAVAVLRFTVDKERVRVGTSVKHFLSLLFATALLIFAFAPVVSTEVKATFQNMESPKRATSSIDGSLFYACALTDNEKETIDGLKRKERNAILKEALTDFSLYTKREFVRGEAERTNQNVFVQFLTFFGAYEYASLFVCGGVALVLIVLCALLLIWKSAYEIATGKRISLVASLSAQIIAILAAVIVIALVLGMSAIVNHNSSSVSVIYKSQIAYGPIAMLICAIGSVCIPSAISKKNVDPKISISEEEFNNWEELGPQE